MNWVWPVVSVRTGFWSGFKLIKLSAASVFVLCLLRESTGGNMLDFLWVPPPDVSVYLALLWLFSSLQFLLAKNHFRHVLSYLQIALYRQTVVSRELCLSPHQSWGLAWAADHHNSHVPQPSFRSELEK